MKTDAEIRAKWKEVLDRPRKNPHVIDTGALVIEVVRWAESGLTPLALDGGDSAASEQFPTPEILSTLQGESTPAHRK